MSAFYISISKKNLVKLEPSEDQSCYNCSCRDVCKFAFTKVNTLVDCGCIVVDADIPKSTWRISK